MAARTRKHRPKNPALARAVARIGGQTAMARELTRRGFPVSQPSVRDWLFVSGRPNAEACPLIEQITGEPCEQLHPAFRRFAELRGLPQQKAAA